MLPELKINENGVFLVFRINLDLEDFLKTYPNFTFNSIVCFNGYENALQLS